MRTGSRPRRGRMGGARLCRVCSGFDQLDQHPAGGLWVNERDFASTRPGSRNRVDHGHPQRHEKRDRFIDPIDFHGYVVQAGAALFEKPGESLVAPRRNELETRIAVAACLREIIERAVQAELERLRRTGRGNP